MVGIAREWSASTCPRGSRTRDNEPLAPLFPHGRRNRDQGAKAAIAHHWRKRRIASQVKLKMRILNRLVAAECPEAAVDVA